MAEHLNKPAKNKGFYVRMRFSHSHTSRNNKPSSCYTYLRWVLWFSISSYFLTSYIISYNTKTSSSHNPNHNLAKTTVSLSNSAIASRALSEIHHRAAFLSQPTTGALKRFKIYIYDLPSKYNEYWLSNERCSKHLFLPSPVEEKGDREEIGEEQSLRSKKEERRSREVAAREEVALLKRKEDYLLLASI